MQVTIAAVINNKDRFKETGQQELLLEKKNYSVVIDCKITYLQRLHILRGKFLQVNWMGFIWQFRLPSFLLYAKMVDLLPVFTCWFERLSWSLKKKMSVMTKMMFTVVGKVCKPPWGLWLLSESKYFQEVEHSVATLFIFKSRLCKNGKCYNLLVGSPSGFY